MSHPKDRSSAPNDESLGSVESRDWSKLPPPDPDVIWEQARQAWPEAFEKMLARGSRRKT